jgi:hypothetical protein
MMNLTKIITDNGQNDPALVCPICGGENTHLTSAVVVPGNDNYEAIPDVRGDVVKIEGWCEQVGCKFTIYLGQHKGTTYVLAEYNGNIHGSTDS